MSKEEEEAGCGCLIIILLCLISCCCFGSCVYYDRHEQRELKKLELELKLKANQ